MCQWTRSTVLTLQSIHIYTVSLKFRQQVSSGLCAALYTQRRAHLIAWIVTNLAQEWDQRRVIVNMEINYSVPNNAETSWTRGKFTNLTTKTPLQDDYAFLFTPLLLQLHTKKEGKLCQEGVVVSYLEVRNMRWRRRVRTSRLMSGTWKGMSFA